MNSAALDFSILAPAFMVGVLVLATHVPLGRAVLSRGIVFIDLAIAQIAGLGVIAADSFGWEPQGWGMQAAALSAAVVGALGLTWTEKRWPEVQEALIGVLFVLAASASLLLRANNPHGGEHLKDLLVGQILWVSHAQLMGAAFITLLLVAIGHAVRQRLDRTGFYLIFACAVTLSVQLVGIYLVFASLIIPALAVRGMRRERGLPVAYMIGMLGYALGLAASALFDLPSGAMIVWAIALTGVIGRLLLVRTRA